MLLLIKKILRPLKHKYPKFFSFYRPSRAKWWARNGKRLDLVAAQLAYMMHFTGNIAKDKVCLEVGCGWVLTHSLAMKILGAKKVIATDLYRLAQPEALKIAVNESYDSLIRDILAPYEDHEILRKRVNRILDQKSWSFKALEEHGIHYKAPLDLSKFPNDEKVDFIFSLSVMEHVLPKDVEALLGNLNDSLNPGGKQFHFIHLEDHYTSHKDPFGFLGLENYPETLCLERGNRMRAKEWINAFSKVGEVEVIHSWSRDCLLPKNISADINYENETDLRITHLGILVTKN